MSRGITRERQVRVLLENQGYWTMRAAGSLGLADVVAVKLRPQGGSDVLLVEVKSDIRNPFDHFGPQRRAALISAAVAMGATPWLIWWPPRKQPIWMPVSEWPATVEKAA